MAIPLPILIGGVSLLGGRLIPRPQAAANGPWHSFRCAPSANRSATLWRSTEPCVGWGPKARLPATTWEALVLAQLRSLRVDNAMRAEITAALSAGERPVIRDRVRLERQMRELALEHAAARLDDAEHLARMARLRTDLEILGAQPARALPAHRAVESLDARAETWQKTDLRREKSDVIHAVYERIVIAGPRFVGLRLTPAAYRHGLALVLPEDVMARPTGFEPATFGSGGRRSIH